MPKHIIDKKGRGFTGVPARRIMRHHISYITILLLILPLLILSQSCIEERPKILENTVLNLEPLKLELSTTSLDISTCENVSRIIKVRSTNMEWAFTDIPDWITVTPSSGSGDMDVNVEVSENTRAVNRVALVNFGSTSGNWNYSIGVTVSQHRAAYTMSLPVDSVMMEAGGGTKTIQVDTNTDTWTIIIPKSMDWCTALKTENGIALTATPNSDRESRTGIIELHTDDVSAFLTVTQRPAGIISTTGRVEFPLDGGIQTLSVNIDAPWTIETSYSWIDVKTKSGDGGFVTIPMEATPNFSSMARDGFIYIVLSDDHKIEIPVHQDCIEFSVDMDTILVASGGSTERLKVQSNLGWQFMPDSVPDWISVDPLSGNGSTTVLVKVKANIATTQRSAQLPIYVMSRNGNNILGRIAVEICQDGRLFGADSSAIHFSDKPGSTVFNIKSDGYWFVNSNNDWITVYPDEGEESGQVKVSVSENFGEDTRVGAVIVRTQGQRDTIPVYQAGKYIDVSSDMLYFQSKGDSIAVSVSANGHWSAEYDVSWIKLSETEGNGSCELTITALDNPSTTRREGVILLTRDGMNPVRITVRQYGRYLSISSYYTVFFSAGGTSEPYIVDTDGKYEIESESDWITINKETEFHFTITVSENTASESRTGTIRVYLTDLTSGSLTRSIAVVQGGHFEAEYVDLGLSVYWATCNVGANAPEEYGDYFAWGEIEPYYETGYAQEEPQAHWKEGYTAGYGWSTYKYCKGSTNTLTKYCVNSSCGNNGFTDTLTILVPEDDVAHVNWGGNWRMPTKEDFDELLNNCDCEWITQNGVNGWKVTSRKDLSRFIFLPAAGCRYDTSLYGAGERGLYWSSSLDTDYPCYAQRLYFDSGSHNTYGNNRDVGQSVRPVCPSSTYVPPVETVDSIALSRMDLNLTVGDTVTVFATPYSQGAAMTADVQWLSNNTDVATVDEYGMVVAVGTGNCIITASVGYVQSTCTVIVTAPVTGYENGYGYVDLGLSVKWATLNVGAEFPEGYGDYYAWGETETKSKYTFDNYKFCTNVYWGDNWEYDDDAFSFSLGKYVIDSEYGTIDSKAILEPEDDVAHVKWGGNWRMPSFAEYYELVMNCDLEMTTWNGVDGWKATSRVPGYTDRFIFFPSAGLKATLGPNDEYSVDEDSTAIYWSNTIWEDSPFGFAMEFDNPDLYAPYYSSTMRCMRMIGASIRPVLPSQSFDVTTITLNKSSITMDSYDGESLSVTTVDGSDNVGKYPITWSSSDAGVAWFRYGAHGVDNIYLYAVSPGTATVTATIGTAQASCTVTITPVVIDSIALDQSYVTYISTMISRYETDMNIGDTLTISPTLYRRNRIISTTDVSVQWQSSDNTVATVDNNGLVTAVGAGECNIIVSAGVAQCKCYVSVVPSTVPQATPEYVDLGLSVNWATFNVGANAPEEYGDYFAWGETEPYYEVGYAQSTSPIWKSGKSEGYLWSSYTYSKDDYNSLTKYCNKSESGFEGFTDTISVLVPEDDAAHVNWGGNWRMPTWAEQDELRNNCTWTWFSQDGISGYIVTSNVPGYGGRSIFLPAAGQRNGADLYSDGDFGGYYWSSSLLFDDLNNARGLHFTSEYHYTYGDRRHYGFSVRPVCPSTTYTPPLENAIADIKMINASWDSLLWGPGWKSEWQYDWDESSSDYGKLCYTEPELIKGTIYNLISETGERISSSYKIFNPDGGRVSLTPGLSYDMLFYNFGTEYISFYQSDDYQTYTASTRHKPYQPDELFGALVTNLEMSDDPSFYKKEYDSENNITYVYDVDLTLKPYSFIYLCQVVILNNADEKGNRIVGGHDITMTGLAQGVDLFTRKTFADAISVTSEEIKPLQNHNNVSLGGGEMAENADIFAAKLVTFGLPGINPLQDDAGSTTVDNNYIEVNLALRSGVTYAISRDITEQLREKPTGGVITVYVDANDIPDDLLMVSVTLDKDSVSIVKGEDVTLKATVIKGGQVIPVTGLFTSDNTDIATVDYWSGVVTGVSAGTTIIRATYQDETACCVVTVTDPYIPQITPEYVDLGLSVKWATFNVGATKPEEYGDYFAWGETETKTDYSWYSYKWCNGSSNTMTKYCNNSDYGNEGFTDTLTVLALEDDVAHVQWGGNWRMPTKAEQDDLRSKCSWKWYNSDNIEFNGVAGYKVTSNIEGYTDRSIFLPAAGYRSGTGLYNGGSGGDYWSSSLHTGPYYACYLGFNSGNYSTHNYQRNIGYSVRPVCP